MPRTKPQTPRVSPELVASPNQLEALARRLAQEPLIAFDTEFLWERTYSPRLGLIQVAGPDAVWLVDPLALSRPQMEPLLEVLVAAETLKVAHAIDQDQICLHRSYGVVAKPVLDTAVAAAMTGMGDQIGLSTLLKKLLRVDIDKGYTRTNWLKRPLPAEMMQYAADDVVHLPRVADKLLRRLRELQREEWALELSGQAGAFAQAQFEPHAVARKIAEGRGLDESTYGVLRELVAWREREADRIDKPRRWLAEDKILVKLAQARPSSVAQLADFRGLSVSNRSNGAGRVVQAIEKGLNASPDGYKRPQRQRNPTPRESAAMVVLRCFLNALAADNQIPVRLLVDNGAMVDLLRGRFEDVAQLRDSGLLDDRVVDLVGEDLVAILGGRRGLRLVNGVATQHDESCDLPRAQGTDSQPAVGTTPDGPAADGGKIGIREVPQDGDRKGKPAPRRRSAVPLTRTNGSGGAQAAKD